MSVVDVGVPALNAPPYHLFGMGHRAKMIYREGALFDAATGERTAVWDLRSETFEPDRYAVRLETRAGKTVRIYEDEVGLWVDEDGECSCVSASPVALPSFEGHPFAGTLRRLHQEILVNITPAGPLPNFLVYDKPWYRDAAMMLMCLQRTGNLALTKDWVMGLREPFDRNNAGHCEPDNLGQALFMVSLYTDATHPVVDAVLAAARQFEHGRFLCGLSDFAEHPVYQTKWMKYGLRALGLTDPYEIPDVADTYSALFWMDYRDRHVPVPGFSADTVRDYPYLGWAEAHFHGAVPPAQDPRCDTPLTWERHASEADYAGLAALSESAPASRTAAPHTWHAAEMMLYLLDR